MRPWKALANRILDREIAIITTIIINARVFQRASYAPFFRSMMACTGNERGALARELGDQKRIAMALVNRGVVLVRHGGDLDAATALFEESLEIFRSLGEKWSIANTVAQLGIVARHKEDYTKAVALCEESLAMFRALGATWGIASALRLTGHAVRLRGDLERATALHKERLAEVKETEDKWVATECNEGLALISIAQEHSERATRLFGAAEAARETFGITSPRSEAGDQECFWATIRERPMETTFAAAWAEGRAMTLEQAVE